MDRLPTFAALLLTALASACGAPEHTRVTQPPAAPALSCPSPALTGRVDAGQTREVWSARLAEGARVRVRTSLSPLGAGQLSLSGPAERPSSVTHVAFWGELIPDGPPEPPSLDVRVALEGTWSLRLTAEAQPVDYAVCVEVDAPTEEPTHDPSPDVDGVRTVSP